MRISTTITGGRTAGNPSHLEAWRRRIYSSGRRVKIKDAIEKKNNDARQIRRTLLLLNK